MTALAGLWRFEGGEARADCERMLKAQSIYGQHHRAWSEGCVALGRRLYRTLPEDRHDFAPQIGAGGTQVLVADVRLDNRKELADALRITDARLRTLSDAALLMRAFEAWDDEAIEKLVGDFAIVHWDMRRQRLLLARDFLGRRPLHYHLGPNFFAVSSMAKGLHALPAIPRRANADTVAAFLALVPETGSQSFFEGVETVRAGSNLSVTRNGTSERSYWTPPAVELRLRDPREYEEVVRESMDVAVAARLRGAGRRVGSQLSGGLDSSTVTATAAQLLRDRGEVVAYTAVPRAGYPEGDGKRLLDEGPLAAALAARHANIEHIMVRTNGESPVEMLDRYFLAYERPVLNLCNAVWYSAILRDAQARGLPVMLGGFCGNYSFSFDGRSALPDLLAKGRLLALSTLSLAAARDGIRWRTLAKLVLGPFVPQALWTRVAKARGTHQQLSDFRAIHSSLVPRMTDLAASRGRRLDFPPVRDSKGHRLAMLRSIDSGNYNKGELALWGVDVRDPTADKRLVELCLSIPAEQFIAGGVPRSLARRSFADRLPPEIANERRTGYQAADWHEGLMSGCDAVFGEIARGSPQPMVNEIFDLAALRRLAANRPDAAWNKGSVVAEYRFKLLRGVSAMHFVRKVTGLNS